MFSLPPVAFEVALREIIVSSMFMVPQSDRIKVERWLRGREDYRKLSKADCVIVSFPNSGRTWLHALLAAYFQMETGIPLEPLLPLDKLARKAAPMPRFSFSHDNYLKDYRGSEQWRKDYESRRVILLVRDPADVAVSQYFQWRHRMRRRKMIINQYPLQPDLSMFQFVTGEDGSLHKVIDFLNRWGHLLPQLKNVLVLKYEDLRKAPADALEDIIAFVGQQPDADCMRRAIAFASIDTMRRLEKEGHELFQTGRLLRPRGVGDNKMKARRAKVGGYRSDFDFEEASRIDEIINGKLSAFFGYQRDAV